MQTVLECGDVVEEVDSSQHRAGTAQRDTLSFWYLDPCVLILKLFK